MKMLFAVSNKSEVGDSERFVLFLEVSRNLGVVPKRCDIDLLGGESIGNCFF